MKLIEVALPHYTINKQPDFRDDSFAFKDPSNKSAALLGIIKVT